MKRPNLFKYLNFYTVVSFLFVVWMVIFDSNNLIRQIRLQRKFESLNEERTFYKHKIAEVNAQRNLVLGSDKSLEKFARETYIMKRPKEDVYYIEEDKYLK